jgi:hypothetical protein
MAPKREHPLKSLVAERDDLLAVCGTAEGRRVLWRIISGCGVWERNPAATINLSAQFYEGRRDVGITLMEVLNAVDRSIIPVMMQDAANAELMDERNRDG